MEDVNKTTPPERKTTMTTPQQPTPAGPGGYQPSTPPPQPGYQMPTQPAGEQPPAPKRGNIFTSKPAIGIIALVVGLILGAGIGGGGNTRSDSAAPAPTITVTATETATIEASDESTTEPSDEPTETPAAPAKKTYKALSSRGFKLLAKDPDSYIGKTYLVYGEITQFDSATGTDAFRADTGPKKLRISYGYTDYSQNTILSGSENKLKKLVEGDCFTAKVTVLGSYSYDTQVGGNTTVPMFQVDSISVYGSTD